MASSINSEQIRVMLWAPARSLSTVFEKCMSYVDDVQIVNEPYNSAMVNDENVLEQLGKFKDGIEKFMADAELVNENDRIKAAGWDKAICTSTWVKGLLEGDFPDKKVIFVKDLHFGIKGQFHMIPNGYRYTFLIRNPTKVLLSQRKLMAKMFQAPEFSMLEMPLEFRRQYQHIMELLEYVKEKGMETSPIIIDADDLQNHPGSILRQYCEALGIPYKDSLLEWPAGDDCVKGNWLASKVTLQGNQLAGYFARAFASSKFQPSTPVPPENEIPADVLELAKEEEPFYQKLYALRIKP